MSRRLSLRPVFLMAVLGTLALGAFGGFPTLARAAEWSPANLARVLQLSAGPLVVVLAWAMWPPAHGARGDRRHAQTEFVASRTADERASGERSSQAFATPLSASRDAAPGSGDALLLPVLAAVDHAPAAIMITDASARIEYVNEAFLRLCGYRRDEVIGRTPGMLRSGRTDAAVYRELWQTILDGRTWKGELVNRRKGGGEYWDQMAISPLRDETGRLSHFVAVREDVTERKQREAGLRRLACLDALTGLSNRRDLMERAEFERLRAERFDVPVTLLMLDVDHFKSINDRYGHAAGDQAIRAVARACTAAMRDGDVAGRYGGEEFAVILPGAALESGRELAERLRRRIAALELVGPDGSQFRLTISIGVAEFRPGDQLEDVFIRADSALYRAKRMGRDCVVALEDDGPSAAVGLVTENFGCAR